MPAALRLTVLVDGARRDVVVPAGVRAGELVPELRRPQERGGRSATDGGATLVRADGSRLDPGLGLHEQLRDGDVLALLPPADLRPLDVVDDPVDAVRAVVERSSDERDVVDRDRTRVGPVPARALLVAGSASLASGALLVAPAPAGPPPAAAVVVMLLLLVVGGVVGLRRGAGEAAGRDGADDRVRPGATAAGSAALAGAGALALAVLLRGATPGPGSALRVGLVLLGVAAAGLLGRPGRPAPALALAVPGVLLLVGAAVLVLPEVSTGQVAAVLAVLVVVLSRGVPWAVVSAGRLDRATEVRRAGASGPAAAGGVDLDRVASAVTRVRELTRAGVLGLGVTCGLLAPVVVATGPPGILLVASLALLLLLQGRPGTEAGLRRVAHVVAALVLAVGAVSTLAVRPALAPAVAVLSAALGVGGLVGGPIGDLPGRRPAPADGAAPAPARLVERAGAVLEVALLLAVLPQLALVLGLLPTPWGGS